MVLLLQKLVAIAWPYIAQANRGSKKAGRLELRYFFPLVKVVKLLVFRLKTSDNIHTPAINKYIRKRRPKQKENKKREVIIVCYGRFAVCAEGTRLIWQGEQEYIILLDVLWDDFFFSSSLCSSSHVLMCAMPLDFLVRCARGTMMSRRVYIWISPNWKQ